LEPWQEHIIAVRAAQDSDRFLRRRRDDEDLMMMAEGYRGFRSRAAVPARKRQLVIAEMGRG
jgi:hypothetical protein